MNAHRWPIGSKVVRDLGMFGVLKGRVVALNRDGDYRVKWEDGTMSTVWSGMAGVRIGEGRHPGR